MSIHEIIKLKKLKYNFEGCFSIFIFIILILKWKHLMLLINFYPTTSFIAMTITFTSKSP